MSEEEYLLVCWGGAWSEDDCIPGSVPDCCAKCKCRVWVAPSGQQVRRTRRVGQIWCHNCFLKDRGSPNAEEFTRGELAPGAREELLEAIHRIRRRKAAEN